MMNFALYDFICQKLLPYTQRNDANMFRISDDKGIFGIKKGNKVIIVIETEGIESYKIVAPAKISTYCHKYPFLRVLIRIDSEGKIFNYTDVRCSNSKNMDIDEAIDNLKHIICEDKQYNQMISLPYMSQRNNIESYKFGDKQILLYDDHRTTLDVLFEIYSSKQTDGLVPNLITFDYHEDCCNAGSKEKLLEKLGVADISEATSRQFWAFTEFDISPNDDDWISAAMTLNLVKDAIIVGHQTNNNVDNHLCAEDGLHNIYSIGHLSGELGNRGCLGDNVIKEPYYQLIRDTIQFHDHRFDNGMVYPFILDFDLDCFSAEIYNGYSAAWPEKLFCKEYVDNDTTFYFMQGLIRRASIITICREPGCCGGLRESNKILGYLDRYFFGGSLGT